MKMHRKHLAINAHFCYDCCDFHHIIIVIIYIVVITVIIVSIIVMVVITITTIPILMMGLGGEGYCQDEVLAWGEAWGCKNSEKNHQGAKFEMSVSSSF